MTHFRWFFKHCFCPFCAFPEWRSREAGKVLIISNVLSKHATLCGHGFFREQFSSLRLRKAATEWIIACNIFLSKTVFTLPKNWGTSKTIFSWPILTHCAEYIIFRRSCKEVLGWDVIKDALENFFSPFCFLGSIANIDDDAVKCWDGSTPESQNKKEVISGVVGAASSVTSIQVANLLRLFKIPQVTWDFLTTNKQLLPKILGIVFSLMLVAVKFFFWGYHVMSKLKFY